MKRIIYALLTLVMAVACTSQGHYKITVTFPDASCDGDTMYLTNYDSGDTVAQTLVANACATIEGEVDTSFMARMLVHGQRMGFVVEKGDIAIIWQDGRATGTNLNEVLNDLDKRLEEIGDNDSLAVEAFKTTYHENVENAIGPWALNYYLMYNEFSATQIDSILSALPARYRNLRRVQKAIAFAQQHELTAPGKKYTDFSNAAGERLSDHLATDKVNIVDFWATVWDKPDDTHQAMKELNITWPVIEGGTNWMVPTDLYGVSGIPHILVIASDTIVARGLQGDELAALVDRLVGSEQK